MSSTYSATSEEPKSTFTVLVTGANSGLGFGICCRLIDEFLTTRPQSQSLHLLFTTRDQPKSDDTLRRLNAHLKKALRAANGKLMGISLLLEARVKIEGVLVDLTQLLSVKALATQLLGRGQPLDVVIWNAGIGGWMPVDTLAKAKAVRIMLTDFVYAGTYPNYVKGTRGWLTKPQTSSQGDEKDLRLGQVFTANTFGHYLLTHYMAPLMSGTTRIIWVSSVTAYPSAFSLADLQATETERAYESSKRLTDIMVLTSELPSTRPYTESLLQPTHQDPPRMYLTHPGCFNSAIAKLDWFNGLFMVLVFYMCQFFGSPWHTITAYKAAVSAVWVALAPPEQLEAMEEADGKAKWGSSTDYTGDERVARTEVEGWGFGGVVGKVPSGSITTSKGRYRPLRVTDKERREEFEDLGRRVWMEMEDLRMQWEKRLGSVEVGSSDDI